MIVVIVPAFREQDFVGKVVQTMPAWVDEVLVIDDGSDDDTGIRAEEAGAVVVRHPERRGVGAALATGYRKAFARGAEIVCVMAGDGQMDPSDLERVVDPIRRGDADYVKGERFTAPGVRGTMGLPRWLGGQVFSRLTSMAVGHPLRDTQCGYTALSRRAGLALDWDGMWPGFGYPNDLLGMVGAAGFRIAEVPVRPVYGSEGSDLKLRHLPPFFFLIGRAAVRRLRVTHEGDDTKQRLHPSAAVSSSTRSNAEQHATTVIEERAKHAAGILDAHR